MVCDAPHVSYRLAFGRPPAVSAEAMVATSQPLATRAGLRALEGGGNAADAALAAAAVLCVAEPMSTGIGGDAFALVWRDRRLDGLDAAGPAPARAAPLTPVEYTGPRSVTVPGAVAGWAQLAARHGRLGLDACLGDAIDAAEGGIAVTPQTAACWQEHGGVPELGAPPRVGETFRLPDLAASLRAIAEEGPDALYHGPIAEAIASVSWLEVEDLAAYEPRWVEAVRRSYRGVEVAELPPPTQGVVVLRALELLEPLEPTLRNRVDSVRQALTEGLDAIRDGRQAAELLHGSTVYVCAVDGERMAVSFIQSLYEPFGSTVVAPGTGIVLQNRGACFGVSGAVEPGRRPFHTIIPGMLLRDDDVLGPFGVMGGFMQAQGHVQVVSALVDDGCDPQAALDRPRFRVSGDELYLEPGLWDSAEELDGLGLEVVRSDDPTLFGGGQAILVENEALVGGSDPRKDGYAGGF
jgi:gamma-glutamyltranspeptidase/glutathione hydrolase